MDWRTRTKQVATFASAFMTVATVATVLMTVARVFMTDATVATTLTVFMTDHPIEYMSLCLVWLYVAVPWLTLMVGGAFFQMSISP